MAWLVKRVDCCIHQMCVCACYPRAEASVVGLWEGDDELARVLCAKLSHSFEVESHCHAGHCTVLQRSYYLHSAVHRDVAGLQYGW